MSSQLLPTQSPRQVAGMRPDHSLGLILACACSASVTLAFVPNVATRCAVVRSRQGVEASSAVVANTHSSFVGAPVIHAGATSGVRRRGKDARRGRDGRGRGVRMLLGFDDTFLGVGAPEVAIVMIVGYFVLGPVELFKLTKEAGVLVGQLRDLGLGTVTNLGNIMDEQIAQAEQVASGERPPGYFDPEQEYPEGEDDEFEDVVLDESGRIVYGSEDAVKPATPAPGEEEAPFWEGWSADSLGLNGEEGPLKGASKFAKQLSGAVNEKVMGLVDSVPDTDTGAEGWEAAEAAAATAAGGAAGVGMAKGWKPPTNELGMDQELANNVPSELSIDEQFERLDTIAALEDERATIMQRLDAKIEAKIGSIKNELLELVDEDFQERRAKVEREFAEKSAAKAAAASAPTSPNVTSDRVTATAGGVREEQG